MRKVNRDNVAVPAVLKGGKCLKEQTDARAHFSKKDAGTFEFNVYRHADVHHASTLLFHGKCAYCEARYDIVAPMDVEHFRPKAKIHGVIGFGYWWFAAHWSNLLPSCIYCNREHTQKTPSVDSLSRLLAGKTPNFKEVTTGKGDRFPIAGTRMNRAHRPGTSDKELEIVLEGEKALLIDPCRDDPSADLYYHIDRSHFWGFVLPKGSAGKTILPIASSETALVAAEAIKAGVSPRGAVSIQVFGLNRLGLLNERSRIMRKLEFLTMLMIDLQHIAEKLEETASLDGIIQDAIVKLKASSERILCEIIDMAKDDAPFCTLVRTWIKQFAATIPE